MDLVAATDTDVSTAIGVIEVLGFLEGSAYSSPEDLPSNKKRFSVLLDVHPDDAEVDVAYVSSQLSIDDVRPDICFEGKPRNKAHQRLGRNLLDDVTDEEIVYLGTTRRHASTKRCSYREAPDAHR
ncbi:hypothetical protein HPB50_012640 [Hyalomma asiaticum]|uniref:Uncharacterized protein n=1 Tax=Hyalomma asiaticum TaxID=266040 RepID=A0ACB7TGI4_HYAAI|nr:hypothetical protein HPB50_012640 [Hyalomma asiaticum]